VAFFDENALRKWVSILMMVMAASSTLASIPRHVIPPLTWVDKADVLPDASSPRAPLPNSQYSDHYNSTVQYRYDKAGGITNISYPDNNAVTYGWDTAGRLVSVKDWADRTWNFSYDGANRLSGIQYPNGVNYTRGYNADGQLTNYVYSKSGTPFISRTFERNAVGMKTREIISAGLEVEPPDTWQKHTSDKADRLTSMSRRDEYVVPERWCGYTPSYNQEGQVTNINEGYQSWASGNDLTWDSAGRLVEYTGLRQTNLWTDMPPMPSWGLEIGYDGLGVRTVRTDELLTLRQVVDRVGRLRLPLMEMDQNNTPTRYYVWAPGIGLLAQIEADTTIYYFHADENGSTLAMTDSNGNVTDQFAYSPWGELLGRTGTNTTSFTFVGGGGVYWEGGSLYRMGARYYDARLKRWLSADPAGMAGGANLYLYASANPMFWVDLLGLCVESADSYYSRQPTLSVTDTYGGRYAELRSTISAGQMEQAQAMTLGASINAGAPYAQEMALQNAANLWTAPAGEFAAGAVMGRVASWMGRGANRLATGADEAVFWSGIRNGDTAAANWSAQNGGATLEMTLAGRGVDLPVWDASKPSSIEAWMQASQEFAAGARGNVRVLQSDSVRLQSVWAEVEFPALKANPNVNSIRAVNPEDGAEVLLWKR